MYGTPVFADACAQAVPALIEMISAPDSRSVENINLTENAISAVTKFLKFNSSALRVDEIISQCITWLPTALPYLLKCARVKGPQYVQVFNFDFTQ